MNDKYLTVDEVAEQLQVLPATVRDWLKGGSLKGFKAGRLWRIKQEDLDEFLNKGGPKNASNG